VNHLLLLRCEPKASLEARRAVAFFEADLRSAPQDEDRKRLSAGL
jgi:hypothetical protein